MLANSAAATAICRKECSNRAEKKLFIVVVGGSSAYSVVMGNHPHLFTVKFLYHLAIDVVGVMADQ